MVLEENTWQPARLFPITGIGGADEQERRGTSALLAVVQSVREFGRALTSRCGAPGGVIETFIEVPFTLNDKKLRPDGLIRVSRGKRTWTALVEVKTGRNGLDPDQINNYLDIARDQGFDAVITISHEIAVTPGVHPVLVDKRKLRKVELFHLSWSRIHTEALIEQANNVVSDPDQAWILSEFVRFIESPKSGAWDFEDMGPRWVEVRDAAALQTLRANSDDALAVVSKFDQLLAFAAMELSRKLGVNVQQSLTKKERSDHALRIQAQSVLLANTGQLTGSLDVPDAAFGINIVVDLRANRVDCSGMFMAPTDGRPLTRINWLVRQLKDAPDDLMISASAARSRTPGSTRTLKEVRENPSLLLDDPQAEVRSFTLTLSAKSGTKRGQGRGSFVGSVTALVDSFYIGVVQYLKNWSPAAPKPKSAPSANAQEVAVVVNPGPQVATPPQIVGASPEPPADEDLSGAVGDPKVDDSQINSQRQKMPPFG